MSDLSSLKAKAQQLLVDRGYNLGNTGAAHNGVDGEDGLLTWQALVTALTPVTSAARVISSPEPPPSAGPIGMISVPLLKIVASPRPDADLAAWIGPLKAACIKCEINTVRRVAAFIAQIAHESDLKPRSENLNYSVEGLLATFSRQRISTQDAMALGRTKDRPANQEAIANCVYGGEWGRINLGNAQPGDGWLFRGCGPLQGTGRSNMTRFAAFMGMSLEAAIAYARTLEGGIMYAAWFWEANDINRLADTPGVTDETRKINGGVNGLADRETKFNALVAAMLKIERGA